MYSSPRLRRLTSDRRMGIRLAVRRRLLVQLIQLRQAQPEERVLVLPLGLALGEALDPRGRRRRVGDLGDEVGRRRLGNPVDEDAEQRHAEEGVEADAEAEE